MLPSTVINSLVITVCTCYLHTLPGSAQTCVLGCVVLHCIVLKCFRKMSDLKLICSGSCSDYVLWIAESCNTAACGQYSFVAGSWGPCSALCGDSGISERNVTCVHNGTAVDATSAEYQQNCLPLTEPVSVQQCFATPCEPYMWDLANWGNCTGGMQNRTVSCQLVKGGSAANSVRCSLFLLSSCPVFPFFFHCFSMTSHSFPVACILDVRLWCIISRMTWPDAF